MLASGKSAIQIAYELKMRRETMARWQKIPEFMYEYEKLMDEIRHSFKYKMTEVMNATITRMTYEASDSHGDPKRIEALLKIIKTLEK
jgi:hypothetical protein